MTATEEKRKRDLTVHAILFLQCYTHVHDEALAGSLLLHNQKYLSKNLVRTFETSLKNDIGKLGMVNNGEAYHKCIQIVEEVAEELSDLSFEYWESVRDSLRNFKEELRASGKIHSPETNQKPQSL